MSRLAGWGGTVPAASVPVTVTVCRPGADTILPAQAAWRRAPCFLSLASMRALPAFLNAVGAAPGGDGPSGTASCPGRGPRMVSRAGRGLGARAPDPALGLVDLSGRVQVETGQHAQRRGVLVRGADGSQGVGHGAGGAGDHGRVLRVGLGAARCQVGDAALRSARAGGPRRRPCPGPPPRPGPRWWRAGPPPPEGDRGRPASRTGRADAPRRLAGPCRRPSCRPWSGPWPSGESCRRPVPTKTSMSSISIFLGRVQWFV